MRLRPFVLAFALALTPTIAFAQDEPPPPEDKNADYAALFQQGLDLLKAKRYDDSVKRFQACIKLFPDRAVSYYNIACAYSMKKDTPKAVDWLKQSFDKGFLDLAHVSRDTDIDNIREEDAYKELIAKTRKKILAERPATVKIVPKDAKPGAPLLVFLHADGTNLEELSKKIGPLADRLGAYLVIPSGRLVDDRGAHCDSTAETCVTHDVKAAQKEFDVDPEKVVVVGELDGASHAWSFATHHGWKRVVAAAGVYEKIEGDAKDLRVFLFAPKAFDSALSAAVTVRDEVLKAGGKVRIERHDAQLAFPEDVIGAIERAVKWTLDEKLSSDKTELKKF